MAVLYVCILPEKKLWVLLLPVCVTLCDCVFLVENNDKKVQKIEEKHSLIAKQLEKKLSCNSFNNPFKS